MVLRRVLVRRVELLVTNVLDLVKVIQLPFVLLRQGINFVCTYISVLGPRVKIGRPVLVSEVAINGVRVQPFRVLFLEGFEIKIADDFRFHDLVDLLEFLDFECINGRIIQLIQFLLRFAEFSDFCFELNRQLLRDFKKVYVDGIQRKTEYLPVRIRVGPVSSIGRIVDRQ